MIRLLLLLTAAVAFAQAPFPPFGVVVRNAAANSSKDAAPGALISITPTAPELQSMSGIEVTMRYHSSDPFRPLATFPAPNGIGVWAVVPQDAPDGDLWVTLFRGEVTYTDSARIRREAPRLFTQSYTGFGPALALNYISTTPARNALTSAAVPGRFVALFATGLNDARTADVTVDIAGQTVPAAYAGPQGTPGLDQINFLLPPSAYLGCYVPVTIRVRDVASNTVTLSINGDPYACAHPLGLTYSELRTLDEGRSIPFGQLSVSVMHSNNVLSGGGIRLLFTDANASTIALHSGFQVPPDSLFGCVAAGTGAVGSLLGGGLYQSAGPFTLSGPRGQELELQPTRFTSLTTLPESFITQGEWRLRAPEGPIFAAFERAFRMPPIIDTINIPPGSTVSGEQNLDVRWNPDVFGANDLVVVTDSGTTCTVEGWRGRVTLPPPIRAGSGNLLGVAVVPHPAARTTFRLPLRDGGSVPGIVSYNSALGVNYLMRSTLR